MRVAYILSLSTAISGALPVLAALLNYKNLDKTLKITALFFLLSALFDLILVVLTEMIGAVNNEPVIHLFIVTSIIFWGSIYHRAFFFAAA